MQCHEKGSGRLFVPSAIRQESNGDLLLFFICVPSLEDLDLAGIHLGNQGLDTLQEIIDLRC